MANQLRDECAGLIWPHSGRTSPCRSMLVATVPDSPSLSSMQRRLASIATHPELADVYWLLGRKDLAYDELYKAHGLLSKAVGGEQKLPKRTGVARERIQLLKDNSNSPEFDHAAIVAKIQPVTTADDPASPSGAMRPISTNHRPDQRQRAATAPV
jgi:hypothetical protein